MSILTAIFQALFQAVCRIFPISETAHSSIFHDFAGRFSGECSSLTGIVHIGIAVGIVAAMYKFFFKMSYEFFSTFGDMFKKRLKGNKPSGSRRYMYMTLISFCPMLLWLIPCGKYGFLYNVLRMTQFNMTLLDDGLFLAITGAMLIVAAFEITKSRISKQVSIVAAVVIGALSVFLIPVSGFSFVGVVFAVLVLFGVNKKLALNYGLVMSVPVLIVSGIVEICISVTHVGVASVIIGLVISIVSAFFSTVFLKFFVNKGYLKYFGIYDVSVGTIIFIVGIFELIFRK